MPAPYLLLRDLPSTVVVNVAALVHADSLDFENLQGQLRYSAWDAYSRSKLALLLLTRLFANDRPHARINAVHPGVIETKIATLEDQLTIW